MFEKYSINENASIKEALIALDGNTHDWQTLFVVDDDERMVGTLTDGDARRALITGASVNDEVKNIMHRSFNYMRVEDIDNVKEIKRQN